MSHDKAFAAAGVIIDSLGREWDPLKHPRGKDGKFIRVMKLLRLFLGDGKPWATGRVAQINDSGSIKVRVTAVADKANNSHYIDQFVDVLPGQVESINEKASLHNIDAPDFGVKKYGTGDDFAFGGEKAYDFFDKAFPGQGVKSVNQIAMAYNRVTKGELDKVTPEAKYKMALYAHYLSGDGKEYTDQDFVDLLEDLDVPPDVVDDTPDGLSGLVWLADEYNATGSDGEWDEVVSTDPNVLRDTKHKGTGEKKTYYDKEPVAKLWDGENNTQTADELLAEMEEYADNSFYDTYTPDGIHVGEDLKALSSEYQNGYMDASQVSGALAELAAAFKDNDEDVYDVLWDLSNRWDALDKGAATPGDASTPEVFDDINDAIEPSVKKFEILADPGASGDGYYPNSTGDGVKLWGKYGAAGVMVRHTDENGVERFLMVQRGPIVSTNKGKWQLPGGALNSNENDYQGTARELYEELQSPDGWLDNLSVAGEVILDHPSGWHYNNIAADAPEMFTPTVDGTETGDAGWFTKDEIAQLPLHPALAKNLDAIFGKFSEKPKADLTPGDNDDGLTDLQKEIQGNKFTPPTIGEDGKLVPSDQPEPLNIIKKSYGETIDASDWKKTSGPSGGSNGGSTHVAPNGQKYFVKPAKSPDHARNEALAAALYEEAGVPASKQILAETPNGKLGTASPLIPGAKADLNDKRKDLAYRKKLQENFAVDAWLDNWDVAGLVYDNIVSDADGNPVRVDPGGALFYRAQGSRKNDLFPGAWGPKVIEVDSLRDSNINKTSSYIFQDMTDDDIRESAKKVIAITPDRIDEIVDQMGFGDGEIDPEDMKATLKARRLDLAERFNLTDELPENKEVDTSPEPLPSPEVITEPDASPVLPEPDDAAPGDMSKYDHLLLDTDQFIDTDEVALGLDDLGVNTDPLDKLKEHFDSVGVGEDTLDPVFVRDQLIQLSLNTNIDADTPTQVHWLDAMGKEIAKAADKWDALIKEDALESPGSDKKSDLKNTKKLLGEPPVQWNNFGEGQDVKMLTETQAQYWLQDLEDDDTGEAKFIKYALEAKSEFGDNAVTFATADEDGNVLSAMTIVKHDQESKTFGVPKYAIIDYIGSRKKGEGKRLLEQAQSWASLSGYALLAEPTPDSKEWWEKHDGAKYDPIEIGADAFIGWTNADLKNLPKSNTDDNDFDENKQYTFSFDKADLKFGMPIDEIKDIIKSNGGTIVQEETTGDPWAGVTSIEWTVTGKGGNLQAIWNKLSDNPDQFWVQNLDEVFGTPDDTDSDLDLGPVTSIDTTPLYLNKINDADLEDVADKYGIEVEYSVEGDPGFSIQTVKFTGNKNSLEKFWAAVSTHALTDDMFEDDGDAAAPVVTPPTDADKIAYKANRLVKARAALDKLEKKYPDITFHTAAVKDLLSELKLAGAGSAWKKSGDFEVTVDGHDIMVSYEDGMAIRGASTHFAQKTGVMVFGDIYGANKLVDMKNESVVLDNDEFDAVDKYTDGGNKVNKQLRDLNGADMPDDLKKTVQTLDKVIGENTVQGGTVYHGMHPTGDGKKFYDFINGLEVGKVVKDPGYLAASKNKTNADAFVKFSDDQTGPGALYIIDVPDGAFGLDVDKTNAAVGENEIIFPRNAPLQVVDKYFDSDGNSVFHMKLLTDAPEAKHSPSRPKKAVYMGGEKYELNEDTGKWVNVTTKGDLPLASDSAQKILNANENKFSTDWQYMEDEHGKFRWGAGSKIYIGDKVQSLNDGMTGTVVKFEANHKGIVVKSDADGKKKARKNDSLKNLTPKPVKVPDPEPEPEPEPVAEQTEVYNLGPGYKELPPGAKPLFLHNDNHAWFVEHSDGTHHWYQPYGTVGLSKLKPELFENATWMTSWDEYKSGVKPKTGPVYDLGPGYAPIPDGAVPIAKLSATGSWYVSYPDGTNHWHKTDGTIENSILSPEEAKSNTYAIVWEEYSSQQNPSAASSQDVVPPNEALTHLTELEELVWDFSNNHEEIETPDGEQVFIAKNLYQDLYDIVYDPDKTTEEKRELISEWSQTLYSIGHKFKHSEYEDYDDNFTSQNIADDIFDMAEVVDKLETDYTKPKINTDAFDEELAEWEKELLGHIDHVDLDQEDSTLTSLENAFDAYQGKTTGAYKIKLEKSQYELSLELDKDNNKIWVLRKSTDGSIHGAWDATDAHDDPINVAQEVYNKATGKQQPTSLKKLSQDSDLEQELYKLYDQLDSDMLNNGDGIILPDGKHKLVLHKDDDYVSWALHEIPTDKAIGGWPVAAEPDTVANSIQSMLAKKNSAADVFPVTKPFATNYVSQINQLHPVAIEWWNLHDSNDLDDGDWISLPDGFKLRYNKGIDSDGYTYKNIVLVDADDKLVEMYKPDAMGPGLFSDDVDNQMQQYKASFPEKFIQVKTPQIFAPSDAYLEDTVTQFLQDAEAGDVDVGDYVEFADGSKLVFSGHNGSDGTKPEYEMKTPNGDVYAILEHEDLMPYDISNIYNSSEFKAASATSAPADVTNPQYNLSDLADIRKDIPKTIQGVKQKFPNIGAYEAKQYRNAGFAMDDAMKAEPLSTDWVKAVDKAIINLKNAGVYGDIEREKLKIWKQDVTKPAQPKPHTSTSPVIHGDKNVPIGSEVQTLAGDIWTKTNSGWITQNGHTVGPNAHLDKQWKKNNRIFTSGDGIPDGAEVEVYGVSWKKQPNGSWEDAWGGVANIGTSGWSELNEAWLNENKSSGPELKLPHGFKKPPAGSKLVAKWMGEDDAYYITHPDGDGYYYYSDGDTIKAQPNHEEIVNNYNWVEVKTDEDDVTAKLGDGYETPPDGSQALGVYTPNDTTWLEWTEVTAVMHPDGKIYYYYNGGTSNKVVQVSDSFDTWKASGFDDNWEVYDTPKPIRHVETPAPDNNNLGPGYAPLPLGSEAKYISNQGNGWIAVKHESGQWSVYKPDGSVTNAVGLGDEAFNSSGAWSPYAPDKNSLPPNYPKLKTGHKPFAMNGSKVIAAEDENGKAWYYYPGSHVAEEAFSSPTQIKSSNVWSTWPPESPSETIDLGPGFSPVPANAKAVYKAINGQSAIVKAADGTLWYYSDTGDVSVSVTTDEKYYIQSPMWETLKSEDDTGVTNKITELPPEWHSQPFAGSEVLYQHKSTEGEIDAYLVKHPDGEQFIYLKNNPPYKTTFQDTQPFEESDAWETAVAPGSTPAAPVYSLPPGYAELPDGAVPLFEGTTSGVVSDQYIVKHSDGSLHRYWSTGAVTNTMLDESVFAESPNWEPYSSDNSNQAPTHTPQPTAPIKTGPHRVGADGNAIYLGDKVKSTTDGQEFTVFAFESNDKGVVVIDKNGYKKKRSRHTLKSLEPDAAPPQKSAAPTPGSSPTPPKPASSPIKPKPFVPKKTAEPDKNHPMYGQPKPDKPVEEAYGKVPWLTNADKWIEEAEKIYDAASNKGSANLQASSITWGRVQAVIHDGDMQALDKLLSRNRITPEMHAWAKNDIEKAKVANDAAAKKHQAAMNEYYAKVKEWKIANGIDSSVFPGAPDLTKELFVGGEANWDQAPLGTPSANNVFDAMNNNGTDIATRGASIATDGDQIEDLDVRMLHVVDEDGVERLEAKFKLTAWAGDEIEKLLKSRSGVTKEGKIYLRNRSFHTSGLPHYKKTNKYELSGTTYKYVDPETGAVVKVSREVSTTNNINVSTMHNNVQIMLPANATPEDYQKTLANLGIKKSAPASPEDIKYYAENKLLSVFGRHTDPTNNKTGTARTAALAKIKQEHGVGVEDLVVDVNQHGRIKFYLTDEKRDEIVKKTKLKGMKHHLYNANDTSRLKTMLTGSVAGALPTHVRWSEGIGHGGMSSSGDMHGAGGDYIFSTPVHSSLNTADGGDYVIMHPLAAARRLDLYGNQSDNGTGKHYDNIDVYNLMAGHPYEIQWKHGIPLSEWWYVTAGNQARRQEIIDYLLAQGIDEINGIPVEQFVLIAGMQAPSVDESQWSSAGLQPAIQASVQ